jgi:hypothetical protein
MSCLVHDGPVGGLYTEASQLGWYGATPGDCVSSRASRRRNAAGSRRPIHSECGGLVLTVFVFVVHTPTSAATAPRT